MPACDSKNGGDLRGGSSMSDELKDRAAIITGGARGIGRAVSLKLAAKGATVVINYFGNKPEADEVEDDIRRMGSKTLAVEADVTRPDQIQSLVDETVAAFGDTIHILVNNAGGLIRRSTIREMDQDLWDAVLDLNLKSVFLVCKAALPYMKAGCCIVNISSAAARSGGAVGGAHYAVAKAGVSNFTRALAKELAPQSVRVNSVEPGIIATRFQDDFVSPEQRERRRATIPLLREGTAEEVAKVVAFLASDEASYVTGAAIQINGGIALI